MLKIMLLKNHGFCKRLHVIMHSQKRHDNWFYEVYVECTQYELYKRSKKSIMMMAHWHY